MKPYFSMVKDSVCCMVLLCLPTAMQAQFNAGSTFRVMANTPITIDSLVLQPSADLVLDNTLIGVSHIAVPAIVPGSTGSIERVYEISPPLSFTGTIGHYYLDAELNGNSASGLNLFYDDGSSFSNTDLATLSGINNYVTGTTGPNTITLTRLTSVDAGVVLPLGLLSFTAEAEGMRSKLSWTTAEGFRGIHFEVERSLNGNSFDWLLTEHAGTHREQDQNYLAYDEHPDRGWNYYRLKIRDVNGHYSYSEIQPVFFGSASGQQLIVYPNPNQGSIQVGLMATTGGSSESCVIMDVAGRVLLQRELMIHSGANLFALDFHDFASGTYFLKIGNREPFKIVKQ